LIFLGLSSIVQRAHPQPGVNLTYINQSTGPRYAGLDNLDRVIDQNWIESGSSTDRFQYGYDRDGNSLYKNNLFVSNLSELYHASSSGAGDDATAYDGLGRLVGFVRGALSASSNNGGVLDTVSAASSLAKHAEGWSLDTLGNWSSLTTDGTSVSRTHNCKNQVTVVGSTTATFDSNGNTTNDANGFSYAYDAWNQCAQAAYSVGTANYSYDARGRRITSSYTPNATHIETTTDLYYNKAWQAIEERVSGTVTNQYVWSPAYLDCLVLRDDNSVSSGQGGTGGLGRRMYAQQDANWNTTALVDYTGNVQERFVYDPYGNVTVLNTAGTSTTTDSYNWNYLHQGGRVDSITGQYIFRHRDYSPVLGRWMEQDPKGYLDSLNLYLYGS
jgi:RHS repeat-associated protein